MAAPCGPWSDREPWGSQPEAKTSTSAVCRFRFHNSTTHPPVDNAEEPENTETTEEAAKSEQTDVAGEPAKGPSTNPPKPEQQQDQAAPKERPWRDESERPSSSCGLAATSSGEPISRDGLALLLSKAADHLIALAADHLIALAGESKDLQMAEWYDLPNPWFVDSPPLPMPPLAQPPPPPPQPPPQHAVKMKVPVALKGGGAFTWEFCDPMLTLRMVLEASSELAALYVRKLAAHPGTWDIVLAWDEFSLGNKLQVDNRRKTMNLSYNFVQLGADALRSDATWITAVSVRHSMISSSADGWSGMLATFLRHFLFGPRGISTAGVPFVVGGETHVVKARLTYMMSDGEGLQRAFNWRGASPSAGDLGAST